MKIQKKKRKKLYDYLWILSLLYLALGFVNIIFAWLGVLCFAIPLLISLVKGNKGYCNRYCGRGQFLELLGERWGLSRKKEMPKFLRSKYFRYGFLIFFMAMFINMLGITAYALIEARSLKEVVTLFWTFKVPWHWANTNSGIPHWMLQFAFGFYSMMLTSTLLGLLTMALCKPRSWCVYCPMGTMTQMVCKLKHKKVKKTLSKSTNKKTIFGGSEVFLASRWFSFVYRK